MIRPRSRKNAGLPPNLYIRDGNRYVWRDPRDRREYSLLGLSRSEAIQQAIEANNAIYGQAKEKLIDRITGDSGRTVAQFCEEYQKAHPKARLENLLRSGVSAAGIYGLGDVVLKRLTPLQIGEWLDQWNDKLPMRKLMFSTIKAVLNAAVAGGKLDAGANPAVGLKTPGFKTKRERLSLEGFLKIRAHGRPMLVKAMNLALVTGQRRGDIAAMQRANVFDGFLHVAQIKSRDNPDPSKVRLDLRLRLDAIGLTVGEAIDACRDHVISRYVIHHATKNGAVLSGDQVSGGYLAKMFQEAREAAGISGENPPSWHEIRSLAGRLYKAEGKDAKAILGHKSEAMAALYQTDRDEWMTVKAS